MISCVFIKSLHFFFFLKTSQTFDITQGKHLVFPHINVFRVVPMSQGTTAGEAEPSGFSSVISRVMCLNFSRPACRRSLCVIGTNTLRSLQMPLILQQQVGEILSTRHQGCQLHCVHENLEKGKALCKQNGIFPFLKTLKMKVFPDILIYLYNIYIFSNICADC